MKLHLETGAQNRFTGYGPGYVMVNGERHAAHLVVSPEQILDWDVADFESLSPRHFESLIAGKPEIVVLGTGNRQRFPHPSLLQSLYSAGIGIEIMDTKAACRTYNILSSEGRKVVAALLVD